MTRLRLLDSDTAPLSGQAYFADGDPGPIVAALAQVPELLGPTLAFVSAALGPGAASIRHKEIAILRTSWLQGCRYCTDTHSVVALDSGLTADEVRALRADNPFTAEFADPAERCLIEWIDAMAQSGPVRSPLWDSTRAFWPEHLLVELSVTIGATIFLNRFATCFELPSSPPVLERLAAEGWT
jgi:AhpD family alkylhydroperoxidase